MILTVKVQQYEWFSFSIETFFPCSLFVGCWFFSQYHIGAILKFLKEFFRSLDKARVLGRVHWRRKNFLWDIRSCKIVISANTVLSQTRARRAQPMTLSVMTDFIDWVTFDFSVIDIYVSFLTIDQRNGETWHEQNGDREKDIENDLVVSWPFPTNRETQIKSLRVSDLQSESLSLRMWPGLHL